MVRDIVLLDLLGLFRFFSCVVFIRMFHTYIQHLMTTNSNNGFHDWEIAALMLHKETLSPHFASITLAVFQVVMTILLKPIKRRERLPMG